MAWHAESPHLLTISGQDTQASVLLVTPNRNIGLVTGQNYLFTTKKPKTKQVFSTTCLAWLQSDTASPPSSFILKAPGTLSLRASGTNRYHFEWSSKTLTDFSKVSNLNSLRIESFQNIPWNYSSRKYRVRNHSPLFENQTKIWNVALLCESRLAR